MSKYILLRMRAPLQSWGGESFSYKYRGTIRHPTLSGVLGLICCALGVNTSKNKAFLGELVNNISMDVFCYKQGKILKDYQTAGTGHKDLRKIPTNCFSKPVEAKVRGNIYHKEYLQSSDFCVILEVKSEELANKISLGLREPKWMPSLGRKACIPTTPIFVGMRDSKDQLSSLQDEIMTGNELIYSVVEDSSGEILKDVPVEFNHKYRSRRVRYSDALNL